MKALFLTSGSNFKAARKSKCIVRNLSFQCTERDLKIAFDSYGTITEVKIPTKPDGKKRGFGFVQFTHVSEAMRAIEAMNMQEIKGRKVATDWCVPQKQYLEMNSTTQENDGNGTLLEEVKSTGAKMDSEVSDEQDAEDSDQGLGDSEAESDSADEDDDFDNDSRGESIPEKAVASKKKHDPETSHDVHEGRTVFVQNLSFDVSEDGLAQAFSEYGHICYAKIAINSSTGISKGCAFVQFKTLEEARNCIDALSGEENGKILNGKEIRVCQAVSRSDMKKMLHQQKKQKNEKEDKRNLYLGREGLVRPGTQAAEGLSAIELKKREKIENAKRAKLKNPNVFFSTTRLCVHNLPKSVDDEKLKELLLSQFKDRRGVVITESRVMRDLKNLNEDGVGRPLGYAFVNFTKHEHALKALRSFNNNPDIFGPIKRPIVEFSLENRKALEIRERRKEKFLTKQKLKKEICLSNDAATTSHPNRQNFKRKSSVDSLASEKRRRTTQNWKTTQSTVASNPTPSADSSNPSRLPFQGSLGTTVSGKKLPLPNHTKPKIRSRDKGKIVEQIRRSKKLNSKSEQRRVIHKYREQKKGKKMRASAESRHKIAGKDQEFDDLVSKYSRAFYSKLHLKNVPGKKWFAV